MILYLVHVYGKGEDPSFFDDYYVATNLRDAKKLYKEHVADHERMVDEGDGSSHGITLTKVWIGDMSKKQLAIALLERRGYQDHSEELATWHTLDHQSVHRPTGE